jgi:transcriptional regulator GlxA family with amidase domain
MSFGQHPSAYGPEREIVSRDLATVAVLMFDGAPMFETSTPISVFGVDRTINDAPKFDLLPIAAEGRPVTTTGGIRMEAPNRLDDLDRAGIVIIPSWRDAHERPPQDVLDAIVAAHGDGALIVSLCMGAFVLCATGLVDGRRVSTNWFCAPVLAELHPQVEVDASVLYVDNGDVIASAGTSAGIDACLHVVRRIWGARAATAIARRMVVPPLRSGGQAQYIAQPVPDGNEDDDLADVMNYVLENLGSRLDAGQLARQAHLTRRTFDRRFREATGSSPMRWVLGQRILQAQRLLEDTDLSVDAVASQVGLSTGVTLRPHFRRVVGVSPQRYREAFRLTGADAR